MDYTAWFGGLRGAPAESREAALALLSGDEPPDYAWCPAEARFVVSNAALLQVEEGGARAVHVFTLPRTCDAADRIAPTDPRTALTVTVGCATVAQGDPVLLIAACYQAAQVRLSFERPSGADDIVGFTYRAIYFAHALRVKLAAAHVLAGGTEYRLGEMKARR